MKKFFVLILAILSTSVFSQQNYNSLKVKDFTNTNTAVFNTLLNGVAKLNAGVLSASPLVNADVSASAAISFTKLSGVVDTSTAQNISGNKSFLNNFSVTGTTTLATSLSGYLKATAGVVSSVSQVDLSADVVGTLPIANGGTGTTSKSWVDLTTNQGAIAGNKAFTGNLSTSGTMLASNLSGTNTGDLITQGVTGLNSAVTNILEFPLNQVTTTATGTRRVDTGNGNILAYSSFEHSTPGFGWQAINVNLASSTTNVQDGVKSVQITSTTNNWSFDYQSSLYPSAKAGQSGEGSLWVQSTGTGSNDIWLCEASYTATPILGPCDKYDGSGQPRQLRIYTPFKSTGSGIRLMGNTSGTVIYADSAKFDNRVFNLQQYNSQGWTPFTANISGFTSSTVLGGRWKRIGDSMLIRVYLVINSASSSIEVDIPSGYFADPLKMPASVQNTFYDGATITDSSANVIYTGKPYLKDSNTLGFYGQGLNVWGPSVPVVLASGDQLSFEYTVPILGWDETTPAVASESVQVSSDTMALAHKATAIVSTDPIGTFTTYTYASGGNTETICATAPTQTIASINTNGFNIFGRAYNATSTCASPTRILIKIGSGLKSVSKDLYRISGRGLSAAFDINNLNTTLAAGVETSYDVNNGILILDAGYNILNTITTRSVDAQALSASGYMTFSASKYAEIASIPVMKWRGGQFASNTSQSINNATETAVSYDTTEDADGFTLVNGDSLLAQYSGRYFVCSQQRFNSGGWPSSPNIQLTLRKNGSFYRRIDAPGYVPVTTGSVRMQGCANVKLLAGDFISIGVFHNFGSATSLTGADGVTRYTTINKVGEL